MPDLIQQIRMAGRSLIRTPVVTAAAVVSLALGLGATTAVFSAVSAALLDGMPFSEPESLVSVFRTTPHFRNGPFAPANFLDLREQTETLETLGAVGYGTALLKRSERTYQVTTRDLSPDLFAMLGVTPMLGRVLQAEDERADAPPVALLSAEVFRSRFGSDPSIVGQTIVLDGESRTVVGVLPPDFRIPHRTRYVESDIWLPLRFNTEQAEVRGSNYLLLLGRLADGRSVAEAETELVGLNAGIAEIYPVVRGESVRVGSMRAESNGPIRGPLLMLLGAVGLVLLIATANVTSLMLARGAQRRHEMALRTALGATRRSIVKTVLVESSVLAGIGVAFGLVVAWIGVQLIGNLGAQLYPQLEGLGLDARVFGFAIAATALVAILAGVLPGWRISGADPQDALRSGGSRSGISRTHHRFLRGIVIAELAASCVLLIGAGLLISAFLGVLERSPGFETESLLTMVVSVSPARYEDVSVDEGFVKPALEAIRNLPGVKEAGTTSIIPYMGWGNNFNIRYEGVTGDDTQLPLTESRIVSPSYFEALGVTLVEGRLFTQNEAQGAELPTLVVVNQALVQRDFADGDVLGGRFHLSDSTFAEIIGVVTDTRNFGPIEDPHPQVYWNFMGSGRRDTRLPLVARVTGPPEAQAGPIEDALRSIDPDVAVTNVRAMDAVISASVRRQRFFMIILGSFAAVALVLTITGLYGVISYAVAQRTREFGIRAALGSTRTQTLNLVVRDAAVLALAGLAIGALSGVGLTGLLEGMLYGVSPLSAGVWLAALAALFATALLAASVPAIRAARVDPLEAIRYE
jgi:putative ABC transport system permease protein